MPKAGKYSRTNYRLTGGKVDVGELASILIQLRITIQHDSATGDEVTFSMSGYGRALWALAFVASTNTLTCIQPVDRFYARVSVASDSSLAYLTLHIADLSAGSLGATQSIPYNVIALIGSR